MLETESVISDDWAKLQMESIKKQLPHIKASLFGQKEMIRLIDIVKSYIIMSRPITHFPKKRIPITYPDYRVFEDRINRISSPFDVFICTTAACLHHEDGKNIVHARGGEDDTNFFVSQVIQRYSGWKITADIFNLPSWCFLMKEKPKGINTGIAEELILCNLMGVENLLFEIYNDLPSGQLITDALFKTRLESLIERSAASGKRATVNNPP
jgi:hypothetical protein